MVISWKKKLNDTNENNLLTVIIPTVNEIDYLPKLIDLLKSQTFQNYDLIISDNFSNDGTREFCLEKNITVIDGGHPAKARNNAAKYASSKYLLFLDADMIFESDFIEKMIAVAEMENAHAVSCTFKALTNSRLLYYLTKLTCFYYKFSNKIKFPHALGGALLVDRDSYYSIDGFDESVTVGEDHDYIRRLSHKYKFHFTDKIVVEISDRRFIKEGIWKLSFKYLFIEIYRVLIGEVRYSKIKYF